MMQKITLCPMWKSYDMYLLKILDIYIYLVHFSTYFITLGHFKKMYKIAGQFLSSCLIHLFKAG